MGMLGRNGKKFMVAPLWILCNPRSGSSYLCDLLNNTGLFPSLEHPRLVNRRGPLERGLSFNEWLRLFFSPYSFRDFEITPIFYTKCIYHQYIEVFGDRNFDYIERYVPGVQFLWLHRNNIYEQVASLYFAKTMFDVCKNKLNGSSSYHIYSEEDLFNYMNIKVEFNKKCALETYDEVVSYKDNWSKFLGNRQYQKIIYEDLVREPKIVIKSILGYNKIDYEEQNIDRITNPKLRIHKMTRPESSYFIIKLKDLLSRRKIYL
jgi:LPS sulfotransferase NodH